MELGVAIRISPEFSNPLLNQVPPELYLKLPLPLPMKLTPPKFLKI